MSADSHADPGAIAGIAPPETVYRATRRSSSSRYVHWDRDCHHIEDLPDSRIKEGVPRTWPVEWIDRCPDCTGIVENPHHDREWLATCYWDLEMSIEEMAEAAGVESRDTVRTQMEKYDVPRRSPSHSRTIEEIVGNGDLHRDPLWLIEHYWYREKTLSEMAAEAPGIESPGAVRHWMKKHGIPRRLPRSDRYRVD